MCYKLSIVYPYYNNPGMFDKQLRHITFLPKDILDVVEYVFIDDGSGTPIKLPSHSFAMQVFRVNRDIRWNQDGARNIGAHHARGHWLLLTDIDHIIPEETLRGVLEVQDDKIYTFKRLTSEGRAHSPHPNSFLMKKDKYWKIGGYDEDYRGTYGTDILWRRRLGKTTELPLPLVVYSGSEVEGDNTTIYKRDYGVKVRSIWRVIAFWKKLSRRGVRVLREKYDRLL